MKTTLRNYQTFEVVDKAVSRPDYSKLKEAVNRIFDRSDKGRSYEEIDPNSYVQPRGE